MALSNAGRDEIAKALMGDASAVFDNTNAHIGVGGGAGATDAFDAADTDLQGASKTRKPQEATYPQRAANVITFRSLFATGDANYQWDEWGIFSAAAAGVMLSRKVEALGTKGGTQSWQVTAAITVTAA